MGVKDECATDRTSVVSAGIAFYALLSIFPAIAALASIEGLILRPLASNERVAQTVQELAEARERLKPLEGIA